MILFKQIYWWIVEPFEGSTSISKVSEQDARYLMNFLKRDYNQPYICYYEENI